jgi:hypothetical protein
MGGGAFIPTEERCPGLKEWLRTQAQVIGRISAANQQLALEQRSLFLYLCYPWLLDPGDDAAAGWILRARREESTRLGFDGLAVKQGLEDILRGDRHLRECCPTPSHLAHYLDVNCISSAGWTIAAGGDLFDALFQEFAQMTYEQGRFRKFSLSHLFNFVSEENSMRYGDIRVERLDIGTIATVLGETTFPPFLNPANAGEHFVVREEEGACDDLVGWLAAQTNEAREFARVLQYFKDGMVSIDYTVPHFMPPWVNTIRKWGIFFLGNPRRVPYQRGEKLYRLNREESEQLRRWWRVYTSPLISRRLADVRNELRQALLRAGEYYESSHTRENPIDRLIDLAIALESLFSPGDSFEYTFRISQTAAQLIGGDDTERERIFRDIKNMYGRRSQLFHGSYDVRAYSEGRFVTYEEVENWASIIRGGVLRFLALYLRNENSRQDVLRRLWEGALNEPKADALRTRSDPASFIRDFEIEAGAAT